MSTTFAMRTLPAFAYERTAPDELCRRGWQVQRTGMGTLSPVLRELLIAMRDDYGRPCLWRWVPDLLAATTRFGKPRVCFVDLKNILTTKPATPNYAIELNALETYRTIEQAFFIPVVMLGDAGVLTVHTAFNRGSGRVSDGSGSDGSGTAYMLVRKMYAIPINDYFGAPL